MTTNERCVAKHLSFGNSLSDNEDATMKNRLKSVRYTFIAFVGILIPSFAYSYYYGQTYSFTTNDVQYRYYVENGKAVITDAYPYSHWGETTLTIAPVLAGYPVLRIDERAFWSGSSDYTSIDFPEGLEEIGPRAFWSSMRYVNTLTFPSTLKKIGQYAFDGIGSFADSRRIRICITDLSAWCQVSFDSSYIEPFRYGCEIYLNGELQEHLVIPDGTSQIRDYTFYNCVPLKSVTVPESISFISSSAFGNCVNIEDVFISDIAKWCKTSFQTGSQYLLHANGDIVEDLTVPDGVYDIAAYAFSKCKCLTSVKLSDTCISVGANAFSGCPLLRTVIIGKNLSSIGSGAFGQLPQLMSIEVAVDNQVFTGKNGILYRDGITHLIRCPVSKTVVEIPSTVNKIGDQSFQGCRALETVVMPKGLKSIGYKAFYDCDNLSSVTLSNDIGTLSLGANAFGPNTKVFVEDRDGYVLLGFTNAAGNVVADPFHSSSAVTVAPLWRNPYIQFDPNGGVGEMPPQHIVVDQEFCLSQNTFTKNGCHFMGWSTSSNGSVVLRDGQVIRNPVEELGTTERLYAVWGEQEIVDGTTWSFFVEDGNATIVNCYAVSSGLGPVGTLAVPSVIGGCPVVCIDANAFAGCANLTSVTVPNSVTNIGRGAFSGCTALRTLILPFVGACRGNSLTEESVFGHIFGESAADGLVETVQGYDVDQTITRYIPASLTEVNITDETLVAKGAFDNCVSLTNLTINVGVENIGEYAFAHCKGLVNMIVPEGVLNIGDEAFIDCMGLVSISFPSSLSRIGLSMCSGNGALTTVMFSEGLQEIYDYAFDGCGSLTNVVIPNGVARIGYRTFRDCGNLRSLTIPVSMTYMGYQAFKNCVNLQTIYIESIEDWCKIGFGSQAGNPLCYASTIYLNGKRLTHIRIPDGITELRKFIFRNDNPDCGGLQIYEVTIPDSVDIIGKEAFMGCNLKKVTIPQSVCTSTMATIFPTSYQSITNVILTDGVRRIDTSTFSGCSGITSITIPPGLSEIGDTAFGDCTSLSMVELPNNIGTLSIGSHAFNEDTCVRVAERNGYTLCWTNAFGEIVADPFHSSVAVTVSLCWQQPQVTAPSIEPASSTSFANISQEVRMSCDDVDTIILYTTDGSEPSANGQEYTHPFSVYKSCLIRAIARKPPLCDSSEVRITLTRAEPLSEAVNLYGYLMETDTGNPWTVVTDVSHDGVSCVKSGAIGHGGTTWLQTSVRKAGTVSFWWKAACEEAEEEDGETYWYDYGSFLVDGVVKAQIVGNDTGWRKVEVEVPSGGKHVLRWEYVKDGATSYSPDCVWLDQVQWIPADGDGYTLTTPEPVPYSWLSGYNLGLDSDFETAAWQSSGKHDTSGRGMSVWQDYVMGTCPTNVDDHLRATITFADGTPIVGWTPNLNTNGIERIYTVWGKTNLTDAAWMCPTNSGHRFFKVTVEMP